MYGIRPRGLLDLPNEVLRLIAEQLYDPLVLTQQDRLSTLPSTFLYFKLIISMGHILDCRHVTYETGCAGFVDRIRMDMSSSQERSQGRPI
jgi:hypothetical protein